MQIGIWTLVLSLSGLLGGPAHSQDGPDLVDLVVGWASGSLRSPVHCEIDGVLLRGVRRVKIEPLTAPGRPPNLVIRFTDLHPGEASRCIDSTGQPVPNLVGSVQLRLPGRPHPETARRDFRLALKRKKGFDFAIVEGIIKIEPVGLPGRPPQIVDFRGGEARIGLVYPATDEARELAPFKSQRKFSMTLQAASGETLRMPLFDPAGR